MSQATIQLKPTLQPGRRHRAEARRAIAVCVFLALAVLLVFGRTCWQGFLSNYDDGVFVLREPHVSAGFSWSGIAWAFTGGPVGDWYPLSMLSHMLDCQLYGVRPAGHHLTNVLLHAASAVSLFLVLWRMTAQRAVPTAAQASATSTGLWPSALVAALFALHPLRVESVAWIAERRDVLSGLFFMLTLGAYDEYSRHPRSLGRYLAVVGLFVLGLLAKSMLVTLPPLLLLLDFWPLGRFRGAQQPAAPALLRPAQSAWWLIVEKLPLLALALAAAGMTTHGLDKRSLLPLALPERLAGAAVSYVAYLGQLFVPVGLSAFYSFPESGLPAWQVVSAVVLLLAITVAAIVYRRSLPYLFVGWFWYLGMLLPVIGLIPLSDHARADRYTYLSQIGLYLALVWGAMRLCASWPARRWAFGAGSALVLAALVACTWRQIGFWQDSQTLWEHALACDENNVTARYQLGLTWLDKDWSVAEAYFRQAIERNPNERDIKYVRRAMARDCLGDIAAQKGNLDEAIADYKQAIESAPILGGIESKLALLLANQGKLAEATAHCRHCIERSPDDATVYCNLAMVLAQDGKLDEARANFRKAEAIDPRSAAVQGEFAAHLARTGELDEAIVHFRRVIDLDPTNSYSCREMARLLREKGKLSEAVEYDELAVAASRRWVQDRNLRGRELVAQGRIREAIAQFQTVIATAPGDPQAHCNLAEVLAQQGKTEDALAHYRSALEIDANFAPAKRGLDQLSDR